MYSYKVRYVPISIFINSGLGLQDVAQKTGKRLRARVLERCGYRGIDRQIETLYGDRKASERAQGNEAMRRRNGWSVR